MLRQDRRALGDGGLRCASHATLLRSPHAWGETHATRFLWQLSGGESKMNDSCLKSIQIGTGSDARIIAVRQRPGAAPGLFWLGGFKSDMRGTKAEALDRWAADKGRACTRFDYSGHGESGGTFAEGTIGRWLEESVAVFEQFCAGPQVVIGSSMGGWMALLLAREITRRGIKSASLAGLVLIAPAPDFTEALMWKGFAPEVREEIMSKGVWHRPSH
jgi:pimeloyl-ACP methyl ester carboxylesterase